MKWVWQDLVRENARHLSVSTSVSTQPKQIRTMREKFKNSYDHLITFSDSKFIKKMGKWYKRKCYETAIKISNSITQNLGSFKFTTPTTGIESGIPQRTTNYYYQHYSILTSQDLPNVSQLYYYISGLQVTGKWMRYMCNTWLYVFIVEII